MTKHSNDDHVKIMSSECLPMKKHGQKFHVERTQPGVHKSFVGGTQRLHLLNKLNSESSFLLLLADAASCFEKGIEKINSKVQDTSSVSKSNDKIKSAQWKEHIPTVKKVAVEVKLPSQKIVPEEMHVPKFDAYLKRDTVLCGPDMKGLTRSDRQKVNKRYRLADMYSIEQIQQLLHLAAIKANNQKNQGSLFMKRYMDAKLHNSTVLSVKKSLPKALETKKNLVLPNRVLKTPLPTTNNPVKIKQRDLQFLHKQREENLLYQSNSAASNYCHVSHTQASDYSLPNPFSQFSNEGSFISDSSTQNMIWSNHCKEKIGNAGYVNQTEPSFIRMMPIRLNSRSQSHDSSDILMRNYELLKYHKLAKPDSECIVPLFTSTCNARNRDIPSMHKNSGVPDQLKYNVENKNQELPSMVNQLKFYSGL